MSSVNFASVTAFQDYHRQYSDELLTKALFVEDLGFQTHVNVKDKSVMNILEVQTLIKAYNPNHSFNAGADQLTIKPKQAQVHRMTTELLIVPKAFEAGYLRMYRQMGQNDTDIPFVGYIMNTIAEKQAEELYNADINAARIASPLLTSPAVDIYDGLLELCRDEIAAGLTPYAVPGGTITQANILQVLREMELRYNPALIARNRLLFYADPAVVKLYFAAYKAAGYGDKPLRRADGAYENEFGNGWIRPIHALQGSGAIVLTDLDNVHTFVDQMDEQYVFEFQQRNRGIEMWADFMRGMQIALAYDDTLVVTDTILP